MTTTNVMAVDFDGVVHDPYNRAPGFKMGRPITGAPEALDCFRGAGYRIVIHTCARSDQGTLHHIEDWLWYFQIPFDEVTDRKPEADVYLDDKAIRFVDWTAALAQILS
jgi:hypothetical protein